MLLRLSMPNRFQFRMMQDWKSMLFHQGGDIHYIGGAEILPAPLEAEEEAACIEGLSGEDPEAAKNKLVEHNLRLVVYIAKKFDNTGVGVEDLISIGTIGLITLYFLIGSSVGNVVLDYLFVAVFHFGVSGVGWATFLAQGIAGILAVITLLRRVAKLPTGHGKVMLYSKSMLRRIAKIAVPSILQQSFVSVGNIFIQSLVNSFGSAVIAGYSAAIKLNTFTITSFSTLGNALSSFSAQNIGAAKIDRVRKGFRAGTMLAWIIAVPFFVLFFFFGNEMLRIFMENPTGGAMKAGMAFLKIVSPFYFIISLKLLADGLLRGSSAMIGFMVSTFTDLILRVILAYVFAGIFGSTGIWMSWPVGWSISAIISLLFYRYTWKQLSVERRLLK
mgnify:CR=1 FL=1